MITAIYDIHVSEGEGKGVREWERDRDREDEKYTCELVELPALEYPHLK